MPFRMPNILDAIGLSIWHQDCYWSNHKPMAFRILQLMLSVINESLSACCRIKLYKHDFSTLIRAIVGILARLYIKNPISSAYLLLEFLGKQQALGMEYWPVPRVCFYKT